MIITSRKTRRVRGFTLLELMLVLLLLGSLALVTTMFVDGADDQLRFEQTKSRLEQIRRAVIGDTNRTLNGEPVISGFVADMGRLPANIRELVVNPDAGSVDWNSVLVNVELSGVQPVNATLYGGWRGPYVDSIQESGFSGVQAVRDGWGNRSVKLDNSLDGPEDEKNFGWVLQRMKMDDSDASDLEEAYKLTLQSLGSDGRRGQQDENDVYQDDYPHAGFPIAFDDWAVDLTTQPVSVVVHGVPALTRSVKLQIYYLKGNNPHYYTSEPFDISSSLLSGVTSASYQASFIHAGQDDPPPAEAGTALPLPLGAHVATIICADAGQHLYDGDCDGNFNGNLYYFKLIPRAQLPAIHWNISP